MACEQVIEPHTLPLSAKGVACVINRSLDRARSISTIHDPVIMSNIQNRQSSSSSSSARSSPEVPFPLSTASVQRSYRMQYRVYPWRWFMLASITLLNISNGMVSSPRSLPLSASSFYGSFCSMLRAIKNWRLNINNGMV